MYKYLVLGAILSLQLGEILSMRPTHQYPVRHPYIIRKPPIYRSNVPRWYNPSSHRNPLFGVKLPLTGDQINPRGCGNTAEGVNDSIDSPTQQTPTDVSSNNVPIDSISAPIRNTQTELSNSVNIIGKQLSSEYFVTKGIGAHKLHLRKLPWNKARKICIDEGGQLADIRSDSEEKIVLRMLFEDSVDFAWIGYHDMFEEGDWVSVLGEPFGKSGWDRWWKKRLPNPDNGDGDDEEDCACLMKDGGGINDNNCSREMPFVCKITAL